MNAEHRAPIRLDKRVEQMDMELKEHFVEFRTFVSESLAGLETRLTKRFDSRLDAMDRRLDGVEKRLDGVEKRLDGVEKRLDGVEKRLDGMEKRLDGLQTQFGKLEAKIDILLRRHTGKSARRARATKPPRRRR